ncbi:MAG: hypothetical protein L0331_33460, partial [Chloroflexi bacterium]|nr:hypothetical protein [Chloroflexota bacterium]
YMPVFSKIFPFSSNFTAGAAAIHSPKHLHRLVPTTPAAPRALFPHSLYNLTSQYALRAIPCNPASRQKPGYVKRFWLPR